MPVFLHNLSLENYRGISIEQKITGLRAFNFFIGANNSGKSTILNFVSRHLPLSEQPQNATKLEALEVFDGSAGAPIRFKLGFSLDEVKQAFGSATTQDVVSGQLGVLVDKILDVYDEDGVIWFECSLPFSQRPTLRKVESNSLLTLFPQGDWYTIWSKITGSSQGSIHQHWVPETIRTIDGSVSLELPSTSLIPAIRQIGPKDHDFDDLSGKGLIDRLAAIQSPDHDRRADRENFNRINGFLQTVTDRPDAVIEVPHNRQHILVHMNDRVLPLSSLGTGIQEVIMIAAFCTLSSREIVCIEEPELHLHPLLQRKLIRYLQKETDNQYFIATHSAAFIDTPDAAIFHVTLESGTTRIRRAEVNQDRHAICADLGHRASDIIQSNAVLWVEGPSDRIYLKHWLSLASPELVEGIHYSIMFYGGRLLSHLSAGDDDVDEFIELRALNRNLAVMIDSDKSAAQSRVNATKVRLQTEFEKHGGIAWITKGREVENYVDHGVLQAAVKAVYGSRYGRPLSGGIYDHALQFERSELKKTRTKAPPTSKVETDVDKVAVARELVKSGSLSLDILDLKMRIGEIVNMIKKANA